MIKTALNGQEIDRILKAFLDVQKEENNGKVLYIYKGQLAVGDPDYLFNVIHLQ